MPAPRARKVEIEKDRLPGAVTTHASAPLLSAFEIRALALFLLTVAACVLALECWGSRPFRTHRPDAPHPFSGLSAPAPDLGELARAPFLDN